MNILGPGTGALERAEEPAIKERVPVCRVPSPSVVGVQGTDRSSWVPTWRPHFLEIAKYRGEEALGPKQEISRTSDTVRVGV